MGLEIDRKCVICLNSYNKIDFEAKVDNGPNVFQFMCKLFNIPSSSSKNQFEYLRSWDFCGNCHLLIQSAESTYHQIELLQQNLDTVKRSLQCNLLHFPREKYRQGQNNNNKRNEQTEALRRYFTSFWKEPHPSDEQASSSSASRDESKHLLVAFAADGTVVEASAELQELSDSISIPSTRITNEDSNDNEVQQPAWLAHGYYELGDGGEDSKDSSSGSVDSVSNKRRSGKRSRSSGKKVFSCYFCCEGFTLVRNLNRHVLKIHGERAYFVCPLCGLDFKAEIAPPDQEESSSGSSVNHPYFCRINDCRRRFQTVSELRSHHMVKCSDFFEANENTVMYSCAWCTMLFSTENDLSTHVSTFHKKVSTCDTRSPYWPLKLDQFIMHSSTEDSQQSREFRIPNPRKLTGGTKAIRNEEIRPQRHALEDSNSTGETFKCHYCPKRFLTDHGRRQHAKVHKNVKPISCAVCHEGFTMLCNLRRHVLKAHFSPSQFSCPLCGLDFTLDPTSGSFQDDSAFVCSLPGCSRTFHTPPDLQAHHLAECSEIQKLKGLTRR